MKMFIQKVCASWGEWWALLAMKRSKDPERQLRCFWSALEKGYLSIIHCYMENGGNLNIYDKKGQTPLFLAAKAGDNEMVKCLVKLGANVNAPNKDGLTPLRAALPKWAEKVEGHESVLSTLVEEGAELTMITIPSKIQGQEPEIVHPIHLATMLKFNTAVETMLRHGVDREIRDNFSATSLYWAARARNLEAAKILLRWGADVNSRNTPRRRTPLHKAAEEGYLLLVEMLLEAGADPVAVDYKGRVPRGCAETKRNQLDQLIRNPRHGYSEEISQQISDLDEVIERLSDDSHQ